MTQSSGTLLRINLRSGKPFVLQVVDQFKDRGRIGEAVSRRGALFDLHTVGAASREPDSRVARRNQCKGDPSDTRITASVRRLTYTNCAENGDVILYTVAGGGHTWPGGKSLPEWTVGRTTREISATRVMWAFFIQHARGPN